MIQYDPNIKTPYSMLVHMLSDFDYLISQTSNTISNIVCSSYFVYFTTITGDVKSSIFPSLECVKSGNTHRVRVRNGYISLSAIQGEKWHLLLLLLKAQAAVLQYVYSIFSLVCPHTVNKYVKNVPGHCERTARGPECIYNHMLTDYAEGV